MLFVTGDTNQTPDMAGDEAGDDARRLAQAIHGAGMGSSARIALEALKPLHWIAGQFAWALEPFLGTSGPFSRKSATSMSSMARLLEREGGVSELTSHLDALLEQAKNADKGRNR